MFRDVAPSIIVKCNWYCLCGSLRNDEKLVSRLIIDPMSVVLVFFPQFWIDGTVYVLLDSETFEKLDILIRCCIINKTHF